MHANLCVRARAVARFQRCCCSTATAGTAATGLTSWPGPTRATAWRRSTAADRAAPAEDVGGVSGSTTLRGQIVRGLHPDQSADNLLFRDIFLDTAQLARVVMAMPDVDAARVGATGGLQGGALTLACASLEPSIKLAAPDLPRSCATTNACGRWIWPRRRLRRAARTWFRQFDPLHQRARRRSSPGSATSTASTWPSASVRACSCSSDSWIPSARLRRSSPRTTASPRPRISSSIPTMGTRACLGSSDRIREFMSSLWTTINITADPRSGCKREALRQHRHVHMATDGDWPPVR